MKLEMGTVGRESVRSIVRRELMQDVVSSVSTKILDVHVISPYTIEKGDVSTGSYKTFQRILEKVKEQSQKTSSMLSPSSKRKIPGICPPHADSSVVIEDHWLLSVPNSLRNCEQATVNYLGMLIAIDFRHWAEVSGESHAEIDTHNKQAEACVGTEVEGFTDFYTVISSEDRSPSDTKNQWRSLHTEEVSSIVSKSLTVLRGSAAMIHLLRRAVEEYNILWYDPEYLAQFSSVHAAGEVLRDCFVGCREDLVTPLLMPATEERLELLLSIAEVMRSRQTSFYNIFCMSNGFIFSAADPPLREMHHVACSDSPPCGFVSQLLELHPRYWDVACCPLSSGHCRIPVLKLAQLTVLALSQALPALWSFRGQSGLPLVPEGFVQHAWIRDVAEFYHSLENNESPPLFRDIRKLSICCDYQIPRALRDCGLLVYNNRLSNLVDRRVLLETGGTDEGAIRVGALLAVELLMEYLNKKFSFHFVSGKDSEMGKSLTTRTEGGFVSIQALDYALWYIGRHPLPGIESKHHLCRTIMY